MTPTRRKSTLFRPEAIEHHRTGEDAVLLPHYATLPVRVALWSLIALVLVAGVLAFAVSVPSYASGSAAVVDTPGGRSIAVLVPDREASRWRVGELLVVTFDQSPEPVITRIDAVLPPDPGAGVSACLPGGTGAAPADSSTTAMASLPGPAAGVPVRSVGQATVETGRQSLLSWIVP